MLKFTTEGWHYAHLCLFHSHFSCLFHNFKKIKKNIVGSYLTLKLPIHDQKDISFILIRDHLIKVQVILSLPWHLSKKRPRSAFKILFKSVSTFFVFLLLFEIWML